MFFKDLHCFESSNENHINHQ